MALSAQLGSIISYSYEGIVYSVPSIHLAISTQLNQDSLCLVFCGFLLFWLLIAISNNSAKRSDHYHTVTKCQSPCLRGGQYTEDTVALCYPYPSLYGNCSR